MLWDISLRCCEGVLMEEVKEDEDEDEAIRMFFKIILRILLLLLTPLFFVLSFLYCYIVAPSDKRQFQVLCGQWKRL